MAFPVTIPRATLSLEQAVILAWKKQPGSRVEKGEILFEMETDKVVVEVPAPVSGCLLRIDIAGGVAKVDQAVGWIGEAGEVPGSAPLPEHFAPSACAPAGAPSRPSEVLGNLASPAARRRARELGLDLARVSGSGPGGRITEKDVEASARRMLSGEES